MTLLLAIIILAVLTIGTVATSQETNANEANVSHEAASFRDGEAAEGWLAVAAARVSSFDPDGGAAFGIVLVSSPYGLWAAQKLVDGSWAIVGSAGASVVRERLELGSEGWRPVVGSWSS